VLATCSPDRFGAGAELLAFDQEHVARRGARLSPSRLVTRVLAFVVLAAFHVFPRDDAAEREFPGIIMPSGA
jgi:hypothetical protein